MWINLLIICATFCFMELIAWFVHKYVMHGPLWKLHRDHHQGHDGFFEKNDAFYLLFAIPAAYCYLAGIMHQDVRLYPGIGISLYGLAYFFVHDVIIHQRFKLLRNWQNSYMLGIRRAHKVHHKHLDKKNGENFGILIVPLKYFLHDKKHLL